MSLTDEKLLEAKALYEAGKIDEAVILCRELVKDRPKSVKVHLALGNLLMKSGHGDDARLHFTTILEIDPSHEAARKHLADLDAAEEHLLGFDEEEPALKRLEEEAKPSRKGCLSMIVLAAFALLGGISIAGYLALT